MGCGRSKTLDDTKKPEKPNQQEKPKVVFVLGGPGSGKGTQCSKLVSDYNFKHLSVGDLLRHEVKHNGPNAEKIESALKEGALVNPELVVELIKAAFEKNGMKGKYLLDGFPRSQDNLDAWKLIMKDHVDVPCILYFTCSEETLQKRLLKRGETSGRSDDNLESIKKRFNTFRTETEPIVEHFQKENKVESISAEHEIDEIYGKLKVAIASRGLDK